MTRKTIGFLFAVTIFVSSWHPCVAAGKTEWAIIAGDEEAAPVMRNAEKLERDLSRIASDPVRVTTVSGLAADTQKGANLILIGEYSRNSLARRVLDANDRAKPPAARGPAWAPGREAPFVQEQGYVVDVYPDEPGSGRKTIVAVGWNPLGALFAISHLRTHMRAENGALYLDIEQSPAARGKLQATHVPSIKERTVYWYIAYNLSYGALTPANWQEKDWEYWVDMAVCAQFTHIAFCLWGGSEYYFPGSPACYTAQVRRTHESLKFMISYAHSRGLKVTCLLSPTFIPTDIVDANEKRLPFLRAAGHYGEHLKTICQAEPGEIVMGDKTWHGAMDLIRDVMQRELDWFRDSDAFQVWFYDPGGCYCGEDRYNCRGLQEQRLIDQVALMTRLVDDCNPKATIEVSLWPMWLLETGEYIGRAYRDAFLDRLKQEFSQRVNRITCCDVVGHANTGLDPAHAKGFRTNGFFYTTNPETGYVFVNPMFRCLNYLAASARHSKVDAAYVYRHEEGAKFPNTFFVSRYLWDLNATTSEVLRQYVNWIANTDSDAANRLYEAFMLIDSFTCDGAAVQDHAEKGARIESLVDGALAKLPEWKQNELEWLLTTARAFALLGRGVEQRSDSSARDRLAVEFADLTSASPAFKGFAPYAESKFKGYVDWLAAGWNQVIF